VVHARGAWRVKGIIQVRTRSVSRLIWLIGAPVVEFEGKYLCLFTINCIFLCCVCVRIWSSLFASYCNILRSGIISL
jgi:hypothetical protein